MITTVPLARRLAAALEGGAHPATATPIRPDALCSGCAHPGLRPVRPHAGDRRPPTGEAMSKKPVHAPTAARGPADLLAKRIEAADNAAGRVHEATRTLRETIAEAQQTHKGLETLITRVEQLVSTNASDLISQQVAAGLETLGHQTEEAMRTSVAKVSSEFDRLERILLGQERRDGRPSLNDLIEQIERAAGLQWPLLVKAVTAAVEVSKGCVEDTCDAPADYALLVKIKPTGQLPKGSRGHLHLCAQHAAEMKDAHIVLKTFRLENQMCPWPHAGALHLQVKDTDGNDIYSSSAYAETETVEIADGVHASMRVAG